MIERGDIVSHRDTAIQGRVTGFGPSAKWVRVKTGDGRSRNWLADHLRVTESVRLTRPRIVFIKYTDGRLLTFSFKCGEMDQLREILGREPMEAISEFEIRGLLDEPIRFCRRENV